MANHYEKHLKKCPHCDGIITDHSYDRRIVFRCTTCDYDKTYPGIIQINKSQVPIPYSDNDGNIIDPKNIKNQEYYHVNAGEYAISEFNKWVDATSIEKQREIKINEITKER